MKIHLLQLEKDHAKAMKTQHHLPKKKNKISFIEAKQQGTTEFKPFILQMGNWYR